MKLDTNRIRTQIDGIITDNEEYITLTVSDYIINENQDPAWYHIFLDYSHGECTRKNIEIVKNIIREYDAQ